MPLQRNESLLSRAVTHVALGISFTILAAIAHAAAATGPTAADYEAATRLLAGNLQGLVRNESVQPHWIGESGRFWYRRDVDGSAEFVVVTAQGAKSPLFDHANLAIALSQAVGQPDAGKGALGSLSDVEFSDDLSHLSGRIGDKTVACELKAPRCRLVDTPKSDPGLLPSPMGAGSR